MKLRLVAPLVVLAVFFTSCGFMILRDKYDAVKKVALVQYALNPGMVYGTPSDDAVRDEVVTKNLDIFVKELGNNWQLIPPAELAANPAYTAAGKPTIEHYVTPKSMRIISEEGARNAELTPEEAKKLCADLGVDGVIAIAESWGVQVNFFQGISNNTYWINMYDKDGTKIMSDVVGGRSEQNFGVPPGGAIATEQVTWVKASGEAFKSGMEQVRGHLGGK